MEDEEDEEEEEASKDPEDEEKSGSNPMEGERKGHVFSILSDEDNDESGSKPLGTYLVSKDTSRISEGLKLFLVPSPLYL